MYFNNYVKVISFNINQKQSLRFFEKYNQCYHDKLHFSVGRFIRDVMLMTYLRIERLLLSSGFLDFY